MWVDFSLQNIDKLLQIIDTLSLWVDEIKPIGQPQRFGNKAFTKWWKRVEEVSFLHCIHSNVIMAIRMWMI